MVVYLKLDQDGEVENTYFKNSDLKFGLGYT